MRNVLETSPYLLVLCRLLFIKILLAKVFSVNFEKYLVKADVDGKDSIITAIIF